jgi:hypothetical protein
LRCVGIRSDLLDVAQDILCFDWRVATHTGPHERRAAAHTDLRSHVSAAEVFTGVARGAILPSPEKLITGMNEEAL